MRQDANALMEYLKKCVSPYHGAAVTMELLREEGFTELPLNGAWQLAPGGRYCVACHGTMAVGFTIGESFAPEDGFRIAASHLDWPCLYIKPDPEQIAGGCLKLSVEPYGGLILNTWLDRPLSCAGLVTLKGESSMRPREVLFDFGRPVCTIPNLAIHMNREVNKGVAMNPAKDMLPLAATIEKEFNKNGYFIRELAKAIPCQPEDILSFDLVVYNAESPSLVGFEQDMLSSPRLDNLTSAFAGLAGITAPQRKTGVNVAAFFDNEEIGSRTKSGANSGTLGFIMEKIALSTGLDREGYLNALLSGFLLSCDVAHALHPNKMEFYDPQVNAPMNSGVTIKMNYSQSYTTQAGGIGAIEALCLENDIPYRRYMNKADSKGGGTLGGYVASACSMQAVDVGVPILAMHSSRELMGVRDQQALNRLVSAFFGA